MDAYLQTGGVGGLVPVNFDRPFWNRTGSTLAIGAVVQLDIGASPATESTSKDPTAVFGTSIWHNVVTPTTAGLKSGIFAIALESIADNASGKFRLRGIVEALQFETSDGAVAVGDDLYAVNASVNLGTVATASAKVLGKAMDVIADADPASLATILFNGIEGLGVHYAS